MNGNRRIILLLPFFLFSALSPAISYDRLPVLVYHHLETPATTDVSCTPADFEAQMSALLREGFYPITLSQARLFLIGGLKEVPRPILITFDDGYESVFQHALPVAQKFQIPMTVFIVTARIGLKPQFLRYLSKEQIRKMLESGYFEFGSHTHELHFNILKLVSAFHSEPNPVFGLLRDDLEKSMNVLEGICGKSVFALAWPYGKFNSNFAQIARDCGFTLHFTSIPGFNEPGSNPFAIKRIPVTSRDTTQSLLKKIGD